MGFQTVNGLNQFLIDYPGMSTTPTNEDGIYLNGKFRFKASVPNKEEIEDTYFLKIFIPNDFPKDLPIVWETDGKIPHIDDFHVNPDKTLCLGSPLRLLQIVHNNPSLTGFSEKCLVPFLYAISYKRKNGGNLILGELPHGEKGMLEDYSVLLGLDDKNQIKKAIKLLGIKKNKANKNLCPCGCGLRLGACPFHRKLNEFRKMGSRSWFRSISNLLN